MSKIYDIRNDFKIFLVARQIYPDKSASAKKTGTVLREFKTVTGINNLSNIDSRTVKNYYDYLQNSGMSNSDASNKVSYFNQILKYTGKSELKQTAKELNLSRLSDNRIYKGNFAADIKTVNNYFRGVEKIEFQGLYHASRLQEVAGLRMSESGGIKLLNKSVEDIKNGILKIDGKKDLAKNDRDRIIILDKDGIKAVLEARQWLKENGLKDIAASKTDSKMTEWSAWSWRQLDNLKKAGIIAVGYHNHGNRHAWANNKYENEWKERTDAVIEGTAKSGLFGKDWLRYVEMKTGLSAEEIRKIDTEIRLDVSQQLGHERLSITSTYLGRKA
ncbi:MAG: site-specific integrase [Deltaproteobacteria bacterium]|nr:site-specific integrase [Deltaproteobacteria bacterium]